MSKHKVLLSAVACLLVLFAQMGLASPLLSLTYDEPIYTATGYAVLTTGDLHWHGVIGHPPLINMLTAWPLLLESTRPDATQVPAWGTDDSLGFSRDLLARFDSLDRVILVTRIPVMWLTLLLAALVYRWARQVWGRAAGLLALITFAFNPNIIAHGMLNTLDMGVTAFGFMVCYGLARYARRPSLASYLGTGLALGAALGSKTSGLFLIGAVGLLAGLFWLTTPGRSWRSLGAWLLRLAGLVSLAALVLWAIYLFEVQPLSQSGLPVPMASYWKGLQYQRSNVSVGQTSFLAGRLISGGHWAYFPFTLLVKTPLPLIVGFLVSLALSLRAGFGPRWSLMPIGIVPGSYLLVSMMVALNIGHRYLLPILPFLSLFIARAAERKRFMTGLRSRILSWSLVLWLIFGTLWIFPDYLAYFNELAGGADGGYRYLADSSIDWGQGLKELKRYLDEHAITDVKLAAFSSVDPALYGLHFEPLPPTVGAPITLTARFNPPPGFYAISVVPLQGRWVLDPDTYDWFRHREPMAKVGHVLFLYDVPQRHTMRWVAQCASDVPILSEGQIVEGFGRVDLRTTTFDCEQSWHYLSGGPGWVMLPGTGDPEGWSEARLVDASLVFQQRQWWNHPALTICAYEETSLGAVPPLVEVHVAPSDWPLDRVVAEGKVVKAPLDTAGPPAFLGYGIQREPGAVELETYWRVVAPPSRPLSLMAHLLTEDGAAISVGDGLGVPIEMWQPDDVIVQRHHLELPQGDASDAYWVESGAYWLDTMERLPVLFDGQKVGDRVLLTVPSR